MARIVEAYNGEQIVLSTVPPLVEDAIMLSFGNSILEFEATLYEKFLHLTNGLVVTCQEFKAHLKNMEERNLIVSAEFLGKECWARNREILSGFK
ncbi:MAG: hypothetical protein ACW96M_04380 [Candidatus Thorarchaeota archaeon]|jgi:hypothetical protein